MIRPRVLYVHVGSARHGVSRFGRVLAGAAPESVRARSVEAGVGDAAGVARVVGAVKAHRPVVVQLQFTHRVYDDDPARAAMRFASLCAAIVGATSDTVIVAVGLHDVPSEADGAERRSAYADVVRAADVVTVCSSDEARRVEAVCGVPAHAIPHPVETRRRRARPVSFTNEVAVLGYLYPGKGHDEVVRATSRLQPSARVVALGGPAPQHDDLVSSLDVTARAEGVDLEVTGWLDDAELDQRMGAAGVAVVPNDGTSASGSLATWMGAGRRPLVRRSRYSEELSGLAPSCLTLYDGADPEALPSALAGVLAAPALGRQDCVPASLRPEPVAARHLRATGLWA